MNTEPQVAHEAPLNRPVAALPVMQTLLWSVRRELWEHRSIYIAPLAAAVVFLAGFLVSLVKWRIIPSIHSTQYAMPYQFVAGLIMGTAFIVGIFYSLDALYGERRDRSILFWKSLPISDLMTVLSKVIIPIIILPLLSFAITIVAQLIMVLLAALVLSGSGTGVVTLWREASFFRVSAILFYHLVTIHGLWYAPLYGWLLLISAWSPRAPFIWAFLPPFVIFVVEKIAFNTSYFVNMLLHRVAGPESPVSMKGSAPMDMMSSLIPRHFWSEPGLWIGLLIAAAFLSGAVQLRRYHGPI